MTVSRFFGVKPARTEGQRANAAKTYEGLIKKAIAGVGVVPITLGLYANQAQGSQSKAEAVAALCDAMSAQAYSTMEMRQLSTPKHELKDIVDNHMTSPSSRMRQYKLIDEAYQVELVSSERAGLVAHEFAERQRAKCIAEQGM